MTHDRRGQQLRVWGAAREHELIDAIRAGDEAAYTEVYQALFDPLCDFAFHLVRARDLAQDVVQDVFGRLWRRRAIWVVHDTIAACLHRAVRNRSRDLLRRERRKHQSPTKSMRMARTPTPADELEASDLWDALSDLLGSLSPRGRDVFLLHFQSDLTYEQIGTHFGIARNTVRVNLIESRRRLLRGLIRRGILEAS
jgi:RNA polymerase sigma-70 factor (ECF subfamily)